MFRQSTNQNHYPVFGFWVMSLDGINGRSIQTLLRGENDSKHPSVLQELDFIIYTIGGGSRYFSPRSRGGLANFTLIVEMGQLISKPKFKIPKPPPPC